MKRKELTKKQRILLDGALILLMLLLALASYFAFSASREEGACAVVLIGGEEAGRYPLTKNGTFPLNGGTNTLVIEDGYAYLSEATCPDKICVQMGRIHLNGQLIVCLPNEVIVTVEGGDDGGVDIFG